MYSRLLFLITSAAATSLLRPYYVPIMNYGFQTRRGLVLILFQGSIMINPRVLPDVESTVLIAFHKVSALTQTGEYL